MLVAMLVADAGRLMSGDPSDDGACGGDARHGWELDMLAVVTYEEELIAMAWWSGAEGMERSTVQEGGVACELRVHTGHPVDIYDWTQGDARLRGVHMQLPRLNGPICQQATHITNHMFDDSHTETAIRFPRCYRPFDNN